MTGSPVNLQRDGAWVNNSTAGVIPWSAPVLISSASYGTNSDGNVYNKVGKVTASYTNIVTSTVAFRGVGVFMNAPLKEVGPYRIKVNAGALTGSHRFFFAFGYPTLAITGTDDTIVDPNFLPFDKVVDSLIMVDPLPAADPNYGKPINFSVLVTDEALTNTNVFMHLSVQRLGAAPPAFSQSVA